LTRVYWANGRYIPDVLREFNRLLRDPRTGEMTMMDPRLLDLLARVRAQTGLRQPFLVISGYRSPVTNALLRRVSRGVARNSMHMAGKAVDIQVPGITTRNLGRLLRSYDAGGVGIYRRFVHVDTGPVRAWRG